MWKNENEFSGNATGIDEEKIVFVDPSGVATIGPAEEPFGDKVFGAGGDRLMKTVLYFIGFSLIMGGFVAFMAVV